MIPYYESSSASILRKHPPTYNLSTSAWSYGLLLDHGGRSTLDADNYIFRGDYDGTIGVFDANFFNLIEEIRVAQPNTTTANGSGMSDPTSASSDDGATPVVATPEGNLLALYLRPRQTGEAEGPDSVNASTVPPTPVPSATASSQANPGASQACVLLPDPRVESAAASSQASPSASPACLATADVDYVFDPADTALLAEFATDILVGTVTAEAGRQGIPTSAPGMDLPATQCTVAVEQTIKSSASGSVTVNQTAGVDQTTGCLVIFEEDSLLQPGETALFVTGYDPESGWYWLVAGGTSHPRIENDDQRTELVAQFTAAVAGTPGGEAVATETPLGSTNGNVMVGTAIAEAAS